MTELERRTILDVIDDLGDIITDLGDYHKASGLKLVRDDLMNLLGVVPEYQ